MDEALIGLDLEDALEAARLEGLKPRIRFSDAPFLTSDDLIGRIPRVVRVQDGELLVSHFKTQDPEA